MSELLTRSGWSTKVTLRAAASLSALNLLAHFIPFERLGHSPDDYVLFERVHSLAFGEFVAATVSGPDRPFGFLLLYAIVKVVGLDPGAQALLVYATTVLLTVVVYLLMRDLFADGFSALLAASLYVLLPNKLDVYGMLWHAILNVLYTLYLLSVLLFFRFLIRDRWRLLGLSLACYTAAIFSYEVGFFLPVVLMAMAFFYERRKLAAACWFWVPAAVYVLFRLTGGFGLSSAAESQHLNVEGVLTNVFWMVPNHYFGRYILRAIVYGAYGFISMGGLWFWVAVVCGLAGFWTAAKWVRMGTLPRPEPRAVRLGALIFVVFLIPNCLFSVQSRHTVLASVGFVIVCLALLAHLQAHWRAVTLLAVAFLLPVSQGAGWNQVVAGRIANGILESIREHRAEIRNSDRVLIDLRSFGDRIPYTWGETHRNVFNYYYGMQTVAPWGLASMVRLSVGERKDVYVSGSRPERRGETLLFQSNVSYTGDQPRWTRIPCDGTFILDYEVVYGGGFRNGNRMK